MSSKFSQNKSVSHFGNVNKKATFYQTARQSPAYATSSKNQLTQEDQTEENVFKQNAVVIGKTADLTPVVSKMRRVDLLN